MTHPAGEPAFPDTELVMVDGREALAVVTIRPVPGKPGHVLAEASARGISKRDVAPMLAQIARTWAEDES